MAIEAIGAKPHMMLHPALQTREGASSSEAQAGDINVTPKSEMTSDGESGGDGGRTELHGRSHVQQTLHHLDQSVRQRIKEALKESELDSQAKNDIRELERDFRTNLKDVYHAASDGSVVDASLLAEGVRDAITTLTDDLKITLNGLLPPVPWVAEIPPTPDDKGSQTVVQDMSTGLDKLA